MINFSSVVTCLTFHLNEVVRGSNKWEHLMSMTLAHSMVVLGIFFVTLVSGDLPFISSKMLADSVGIVDIEI